MSNLNISLTPWQQKVWDDKKRFKVVAAGRRTGKTYFAACWLLYTALTTKKGHVFYIAPTQQQARDVMWHTLFDLGHEVIVGHHINNMTITLVGNRTISLKGADNPDTLRGVSLAACVLDEYAFMKPEVWEMIIRPALSDLMGEAIFIGTPAGRNHFYALHSKAMSSEYDNMSAYHFTSYDNPYLNKEEVDMARKELSNFAFRQEYLASFEARESELFKEDMIILNSKEPSSGEYYITGDLAGFEVKTGRGAKKADNTCFAVVKVTDTGEWWVKDMIVGRWSARETADKVFRLHRKYKPKALGLEKGILKQAVMEPLMEMMRERSYFFTVTELSHGNQKKVDRVVWALEPRFEKKKIALNPGDWNIQFLDELFQFPSPLTHDDMPDALAYIDQLVKTNIISPDEFIDYYEPLDEAAGY